MMHTRPIPQPKRRRSRIKQLLFVGTILIVLGAYATAVILKPFADLRPSVSSSQLTITTPIGELPWPSYGQGAFGLSDGQVIATKGEQTKVPIASAAKVVTALVILERHPLKPGENGPTFVMQQRDVDLYNRYVSIQGSVTPVAVGQKLTQRDMLEALLLPSANNIADALAIWSHGSVKSYLAYANQYLAKKGLKDTVVAGDASGYLPDSTSTTSDLVKLGSLAMNNPVLAEIVSQQTAVIPAVGTVRNYNSLLGSNNIVGVKTGNNDQNGGVFIGAATKLINGKKVTIITALSGAPTLGQVLRDSSTLLSAISSTVSSTTIVKKGTVLGTYLDTSGRTLQAVASRNIELTVLRGTTVNGSVQLRPINYDVKAGQTVGTIKIPASSFAETVEVPIILNESPAKPGIMYRLLHL